MQLWYLSATMKEYRTEKQKQKSKQEKHYAPHEPHIVAAVDECALGHYLPFICLALKACVCSVF